MHSTSERGHPRRPMSEVWGCFRIPLRTSGRTAVMGRKAAIIVFVAFSAALSLLSGDPSSASDAAAPTRGQPLSALSAPLSLKAGDLDPVFGEAGRIVTDFGPGSSSDARAVAIQADGKIVAVGTTNVFPGGFAF